MNAVAQAIADTHDDIATLRAVTAEYLHGRLLTAIGHGADDGAVLASSVVDTLSASLLDAPVDGQPAAQLLRDLRRTGLLSAAGEDTLWRS